MGGGTYTAGQAAGHAGEVKAEDAQGRQDHRHVKPHNIKEGDTILLQRGQLSDLNCPFLSVGVM